MKIDILDLQKGVEINRKRVIEWAKFVLKFMKEDSAELSLMFVDDAYIKKLNRRYRKVNSKTDVLAFPMREGRGFSEHSAILGDVVISAETAKEEAFIRNVPVEEELFLYLMHGILHLLGYDDEKPGARRAMRAKEKELMEAVCASRIL